MPPITELSRIEPVYVGRLEHEGVFTTGILLEVSETPTRRQSLADHVGASTLDVLAWRDEALLLNLAAFGRPEHILLARAGFRGLDDVLRVDLPTFRDRVTRAAAGARIEPPTELAMTGWWEQARTLGSPPDDESVAPTDVGAVILRFLIAFATGATAAAIAGLIVPTSSATVAIAIVAVIGVLAGAIAATAAPGAAGFVGVVAGSGIVFAVLVGQSVLVALPDTPLWTNEGLGFSLGLGAGPPAVIVGWLGRLAVRRIALSSARTARRSA